VSDRGRLHAPVHAPERPGEVRRSCLDVSRARRELGWEAETELRDGLSALLMTL
jgi:UDP-glucose 4-epimerase